MCPAHEAVEYIGELFAMERAASSPEQRHARRQAQAPPILDKIRVRRARTQISPETRRTQAFDTVQPVLAARTRFSSENFGIGRSSIPRRRTNIPFGDSSGV
jgi:Transposase IS66 family